MENFLHHVFFPFHRLNFCILELVVPKFESWSDLKVYFSKRKVYFSLQTNIPNEYLYKISEFYLILPTLVDNNFDISNSELTGSKFKSNFT